MLHDRSVTGVISSCLIDSMLSEIRKLRRETKTRTFQKKSLRSAASPLSQKLRGWTLFGFFVHELKQIKTHVSHQFLLRGFTYIKPESEQEQTLIWSSYWQCTSIYKGKGETLQHTETCETLSCRICVYVSHSLVFMCYPDDRWLHPVAAVVVMNELRARLCFDWLVQVVAVTSQLQGLRRLNWTDAK